MAVTIPSVNKQKFFVTYLEHARHTILHEALASTCGGIDANILRTEMIAYVPQEGLKALHGSGVRDEDVFAVPVVLKANPSLIGYYRLLLGVSQKQFYTTKNGLSPFKTAETKGRFSPHTLDQIKEFCTAINQKMTQLVGALPTRNLKYDVSHLPVMALGAQADGAWRNTIGFSATASVFASVKQIIMESGHQYNEPDGNTLEVVNNSRRVVRVQLSPDPDIVIREIFEKDGREIPAYIAAIEIKGGTDRANVHNRAGEEIGRAHV